MTEHVQGGPFNEQRPARVRKPGKRVVAASEAKLSAGDLKIKTPVERIESSALIVNAGFFW